MAQPATIGDRPGGTLTHRHDAQGFHRVLHPAVAPVSTDSTRRARYSCGVRRTDLHIVGGELTQ